MKNLRIAIGLINLTLSLSVFAQTDKALLAQLVAEERETVDALVLYPEETRIAILEACMYPEALVKIDRIRVRTRHAFQTSLETYPTDVQEKVWDLTRFPNLIRQMAQAGPGNRAGFEAIAENYPEEIRAHIVSIGTEYHALIAGIYELNRGAEVAFATVVNDVPEASRPAFEHLLSQPEVLSMLTEDIELAILAGEVYKADPEWVLHMTDSLSKVVEQEKAEELTDWKKSIEEDPEVRAELVSSAKDFTDEYAYDDEYYVPDDVYYENEREVRVIKEHHYYHYPYWFGYPYWYTYPRWRPLPYWWDCGFYYRPGGVIIIIDLPSYYFMHWYFSRPRHHYYYPRLSAHFVTHQKYHPRPASSITVSVNQWVRRNPVVTQEWLDAGGRKDVRAERFKEFGAFEMERQKYNTKRPDKPLSQIEYLEKNQKKYKRLPDVETITRTRTPEQILREGRVPDMRDDQRTVPDVRRPKPADRQADPSRKQPVPDPPRQKQPIPDPPRQKQPEMDDAREHHRNTWERTKQPALEQMRTPRQTKPVPKSKPAEKPATEKRKN